MRSICRRASVVFFLAMAVAGCDAENAEEEYIVLRDSNGSPADKCEAARKAEMEWRKRGKVDKIRKWKSERQFWCQMGKGEYPGI